MPTLNQTFFLLVHRFVGRYVWLDAAGVFFAEYLPYLMMVAFLVLVAREKGWRRQCYLFCEGAIAVMFSRGLVTEVIRFFYHHERPFSFYNFTPLIAESGWSFPSGHMAWFFALAVTVWYADRRWGSWFFALSAVMGAARVYAGVHWPFDIAGGIFVGLLCGWFVHFLLRDGRRLLYGDVSRGVAHTADAPDPALSGSTAAVQ